MKIKELFLKLKDNYNSFETVEQRSFWTVGPVFCAAGIMSVITTSKAYGNMLFFLSVILCIAVPIIIMVLGYKTKNYNLYFPLLCVIEAGICLPITFIANGGFYSGMPIFCVGGTVVTAFCYDKKKRLTSFLLSVLGNLFVFYLLKLGNFESLNVVNKDWVESDIIFSYCIISVVLYVIINMMVNEVRVFANENEVFDTYMDKKVKMDLIAKNNNGTLNIGGEKKRVTVLFADINRFTSISEKMDNPEKVADYLNTFLEVADEVIHANNGILDKFIGDCAMAYWIDTDEVGSGIIPAIKTIIDIRQILTEKSSEIYKKFGDELMFSAGIEYGDVVLGSIGSKHRKEYTIIGDAVNTASRIQDIAGCGELIVSQNIVDILGNKITVTPISEEIHLKGKNKGTVLYRIDNLNYLGNELINNDKINIVNNEYAFYVCGCRGSFPVSGTRFAQFGGETSCYVLKKNKYALVIDCGTGLKNARNILADCEKVDVVLTHVHYDHILGLLNLGSFPSNLTIRFFGHFGSWAGENTINDFIGAPYWPVNLLKANYIDVTLKKSYRLYDNISATFYRSDHPDNGCIIKLDVDDYKICLFADMENPDNVDPEIARNANMMLFDGMYDLSEKEKHIGWGHSTWQDGIAYAKKENVARLIITHHDPEMTDIELSEREEKAKELFAEAIFARTGDKYTF